MEKDERLIDWYILIQRKREQVYKDFFERNEFTQMDEVMRWLSDQLIKKFRTREGEPPIAFEKLTLPGGLLATLRAGDDFYRPLIDEQGFVTEQNQEKRDDAPFSSAIKRIYNVIWGLERTGHAGLTIYTELHTYMETLLGVVLAHNDQLKSLDDWVKIYYISEGSWDLYGSWLKNIDIQVLTGYLEELTLVDSSLLLHELASLMDRRGNGDEESKAYDLKIKKNEGQPDWLYVSELVFGWDQLHLSAEMSVKEDLLLRLGLEDWLKWADNLRLPILQASAFYSIRELDSLETVVALIAGEATHLGTRREHLMLIALKSYFWLLRDISMNLFEIQKGDWNYDSTEGEQEILNTAKEQYDRWKTIQLEASCDKIFNSVFDHVPISDSNYFEGVFDWINSLSKLDYVNMRDSEPCDLCLDALNGAFQIKLNQDTTNKNKILEQTTIDRLGWNAFQKFTGILEQDESDHVFTQALKDKYLSYLGSAKFNWNLMLEFNDIHINQACQFAYVISNLPDPEKNWESLFNIYKCWYEGWNVIDRSQYEPRRKEVYILMVGACLAYIFFEQKAHTKATTLFDTLFKTTMDQYRSDVSIHEKDYQLPLQLLAHVAGTFDETLSSRFAKDLAERTDSEESFLSVSLTLIKTMESKSHHLDKLAKASIRNRIDRFFWIVESRYSNLPKKKPELDNFQNTKSAILDSL